MADAAEWITPEQLAQKLALKSTRLVHRRCSEHAWPHQRVGERIVRFTPEQVEQIEALTKVTPSPLLPTATPEVSPFDQVKKRKPRT